ncbi:MobC family plasmid mobilization relaxosome protein [Streptacidiphilus sp. PB12-B1b]|uniref:MobC family plasmid mobilization relaxosome protein n=1 Tax=Streptacidiphilus sp. PB12-B1b TaxID=2705012 RepID=UPI0015F86AFD|nr:MobC family plasmid mobilization relaxosome protein [Streptacidiphilus sp. PB12-B1b]QMU79042.1 MobC family plasmid mobilization relaxosome protein [Streptacidiphilus sp. PB12-B1b]
MTGRNPAATNHPEPENVNSAPGGASYRLRRSYGPTYALAPAQGGEGSPAGLRAGAPGDQQDSQRQGARQAGEAADQPADSALPFPERKPRRRTRNPSERTHKTTARLSASEKAEITAAAQQRAVTVARFLATAGLAAARNSTTLHTNDQLDTAIDELAALRTGLARIGTNINQIAHVYNAGGQPRPGELDHALAALKRSLAKVDETADALVRKRV